MEKLINLAEHLAELLQLKQRTLATAESCTGGQIAYILTSIPGSSSWFDRGFVTYSNASKTELLSVPAAIIQTHGAVSKDTAKAMAEGAIKNSHADLSIAITGIAGPGGGTLEKPVGTIWIAWGDKRKSTQCQHFLFLGDRLTIRYQAAEAALSGLIKFLK